MSNGNFLTTFYDAAAEPITLIQLPGGEFQLVGGEFPHYVSLSRELLLSTDPFYANVFRVEENKVEIVVSETVRQWYELVQGQPSPFSSGLLFVKVACEQET